MSYDLSDVSPHTQDGGDGIMGGSVMDSLLKGNTFQAVLEASLIGSLLVVIYLVLYKGEKDLPEWLRYWAGASALVYAVNEWYIRREGKTLMQLYMRQ